MGGVIAFVVGIARKISLTQALIGVLLGWVAFLGVRIVIEHRARIAAEAQARLSSLSTLSAEASLDTTRKLAGDAIKILGDSLVLYQRKVRQEAQKVSGLDKALGETAVANYALTVKLDKLNAKGEAPVVTVADSLTAAFVVKQPPYQVKASVALPQVGIGRLGLEITQDPLPLKMKLSCGPLMPFGVRPASVSVIGPTYATIRLDSLSQSPEVCSPAPVIQQSHTVRTGLLMGLAAVLGWIVH